MLSIGDSDCCWGSENICRQKALEFRPERLRDLSSSSWAMVEGLETQRQALEALAQPHQAGPVLF